MFFEEDNLSDNAMSNIKRRMLSAGKLIKEPDNEYDKEAIKVEMDGLGLVGYVANSPYTVKGESMSAGRLYDKIGDTAEGIILYVTEHGIICYVKEGKRAAKEE